MFPSIGCVSTVYLVRKVIHSFIEDSTLKRKLKLACDVEVVQGIDKFPRAMNARYEIQS
jgi:hypothetical protein